MSARQTGREERTLAGVERNKSNAQVTQALLKPSSSTDETLKGQQRLQIQTVPERIRSEYMFYFLIAIGLVAIVFSVVLTSTILAFVGLGLAFLGILAFFVRPQRYVRSDLMNATAMSSLKSIDEMMVGMGYRERGVYLPAASGTAVVFVPSEPFSRLPSPSKISQSTSVDDQMFLHDPDGLMLVPPGLALANLIERKLGFDLKNCGVELLIRTLPRVLVEDLEIARDVDFEVEGDSIKVKLFDSIYADFCRQIREDHRPCGLGCPMCSALACTLAIATGKPVLFDEDIVSEDGKTTVSNYRLLNESRL